MILTITYTGENTPDIGYLFFKNPSRAQVFELNYGKAHVFYPEVSNERTTIALLLEINPLDLARGKENSGNMGLFDYVNDRPYVSSSFMSTALNKVFGTAMTGRADAYQALSDSPLNLTAKIAMLPCKGDTEMLPRFFEPLGYEVEYKTFINDENFPEWGDSKYVNLTIKGTVRLRDLLSHIYVLIPVFDRNKHYWYGKDEVEKLLSNGEEWLPNHPEKEYITLRYLARKRSLASLALSRLIEAETTDGDGEPEESTKISPQKINLNKQRLNAVVDALKSVGAKSVIDMGCGGGQLIDRLVKDHQFEKITGVDVAYITLQRVEKRLRDNYPSAFERGKVELFQSSLTYKDSRFEGYDAACVIEVIEHLDLPRLSAFEQVLFEYAKPKTIVLTTPNIEYNKCYEFLHEKFRHTDHRFEWTREEFKSWAKNISVKYGYSEAFSEIGETDEEAGSPTQMCVFIKNDTDIQEVNDQCV